MQQLWCILSHIEAVGEKMDIIEKVEGATPLINPGVIVPKEIANPKCLKGSQTLGPWLGPLPNGQCPMDILIIVG